MRKFLWADGFSLKRALLTSIDWLIGLLFWTWLMMAYSLMAIKHIEVLLYSPQILIVANLLAGGLLWLIFRLLKHLLYEAFQEEYDELLPEIEL